jgi:hypothetical protein
LRSDAAAIVRRHSRPGQGGGKSGGRSNLGRFLDEHAAVLSDSQAEDARVVEKVSPQPVVGRHEVIEFQEARHGGCGGFRALDAVRVIDSDGEFGLLI